EVFLPGEDPAKLSQFAGDIKEDSREARIELPAPATNGRQPPRPAPKEKEEVAEPATPSTGPSRRRRRARGNRQAVQTAAAGAAQETEEVEDIEEVEEPVSEPIDIIGELAAAAMVEEVFSADSDEDEDLPLPDLYEAMLVPDDVLDLEIVGLEAYQDMAELALFDAIHEVEQPAAQQVEDRQPDEATLLAEAEEREATAAALAAELTAQEELQVAEPVFEVPAVETEPGTPALEFVPVAEPVETLALAETPVEAAPVETAAETNAPVEAAPVEALP